MDTNAFWQVPVNYLAVLICAIANMILGFLWYGPLYGKEWNKLVGFTAEKMEKAKKSMNRNYIIMFITSLVTAWILFHFIWYAAPGSLTLLIALKIAVYAWLGFIATTALTKHLFTPDTKPVKLLFIESGYQLASLLLMGVIFFLFK